MKLSLMILGSLEVKRLRQYELNNEKIETALKNCSFEDYNYNKNGYYEVSTNVSWFSWGETITLIPIEKKILINSKPNGTKFKPQPITIFKDKKNIKRLINEL